MHMGFVPRDLVQRVTSLQEQQCQLVAQGLVGELGVKCEGQTQPRPREPLLAVSLCSGSCFACQPGCPANALCPGKGGGPGLEVLAFPLRLTDPQPELCEGHGPGPGLCSATSAVACEALGMGHQR